MTTGSIKNLSPELIRYYSKIEKIKKHSEQFYDILHAPEQIKNRHNKQENNLRHRKSDNTFINWDKIF